MVDSINELAYRPRAGSHRHRPPGRASGEASPSMPFLHVRALPSPSGTDIGAAVRAISSEFARATGTEERHITVTWEQIDANHYSHAGQLAEAQPGDTHPSVVEVLAPDSNAPERIGLMLESAARSVGRAAGVPVENVFAEFRPARSGWIVDRGRAARW